MGARHLGGAGSAPEESTPTVGAPVSASGRFCSHLPGARYRWQDIHKAGPLFQGAPEEWEVSGGGARICQCGVSLEDRR